MRRDYPAWVIRFNFFEEKQQQKLLSNNTFSWIVLSIKMKQASRLACFSNEGTAM